MQQNPYESPQEVESKPHGGVLLIVLAIAGVIPAGCICGGVTCISVSTVGEAVRPSQPNFDFTLYFDLMLALPFGLLMMGAIWFLLGRALWQRRHQFKK